MTVDETLERLGLPDRFCLTSYGCDGDWVWSVDRENCIESKGGPFPSLIAVRLVELRGEPADMNCGHLCYWHLQSLWRPLP